MPNILTKLKDWIEERSPKHYSFLLAIPIIFLIVGFFIWNIYLYSFGFVEDELLRAKFISAGFFFFIFSFALWVILYTFLDLVSFIFSSIQKLVRYFIKFVQYDVNSKISLPYGRILIFIILAMGWFIFYIFWIFPILPPAFGGGQPRSISLTANEKAMPILNSLEIKLAEGATYQTENLCIVHEDTQGIYVIRENRILMLNSSLFQGFGSLVGVRAIHEQTCIKYAKQRSLEGVYFSYILFKTQVENLFGEVFGYPEKVFDIVIIENQPPDPRVSK